MNTVAPRTTAKAVLRATESFLFMLKVLYFKSIASGYDSSVVTEVFHTHRLECLRIKLLQSFLNWRGVHSVDLEAHVRV